jgi:hypothetical protein
MLRRQTNSAVRRRMNALLLLDAGWTPERVAEGLLIEAETVREHRRLSASAGRAGVERLASVGHAPVLSEAQANTTSVTATPLISQSICNRITVKGVSIALPAASRCPVSKRVSMKPASRPTVADPVAGSSARLRFQATSSATKGRPLVQRTLRRRCSVQVLRSALGSQRSSSSGRVMLSVPVRVRCSSVWRTKKC